MKYSFSVLKTKLNPFISSFLPHFDTLAAMVTVGIRVDDVIT